MAVAALVVAAAAVWSALCAYALWATYRAFPDSKEKP